MRYHTPVILNSGYPGYIRSITSVPLLIMAMCLVSVISMAVIKVSPALAVTGSEAIVTDEIEYMIGDTVAITGTNFDPGVNITIDVVRVDGIIDTGVTTTDGSGSFVYNYYLNPNALPDPELAYFGMLTVKAFDEESTLLATTTFLDNPHYLLQGCSKDKGGCADSLSGTGWADGTTPMSGWTNGNVKGWYEQEYVPYRLRINLRKSDDGNKNYYILNQHDHFKSGIYGVDGLGDYYVGSGPGSIVTPEGKLTKNCIVRAAGTGILVPTTGNPCYVSGPIYSGVDDDGDSLIDEETVDGIDNDGDGLIDEDCNTGSNPTQQIQFVSAIRFLSSEAGSSNKSWALYWKAHLAAGSSTFPGASLHAKTTSSGNQNVPIANVLAPAAADLSITKSDSPDPVSAGGTITYTISVTNNGPDAASSIQMTDTLPAGVTFVSASGTNWTCGHSAGVVTCTRSSSLSSGSTAHPISIVVIAPSPVSQTNITNTASVSGTPNDPNTGNNTAAAVTTVNAVPIPASDLSITKSDAPDPVNATGVLVYTLSVANAGPNSATLISVTDTLPAGVTFVSAGGSGWTCGEAGGVVSCTRPSLSVVTAPNITITVNAPSAGGAISNTASVTGYENDPDSANNITTITTNVTAVADMSITKTDSPDPVDQGQQITYVLTVSNAGPSTAPGVTVTDTLPLGSTFVSAIGSGWSCSHDGNGIVTCTNPSMNAGTTAPVITIKVAAPSQAGSISNSATVSSTAVDPNTGNNTASAATTVNTAANLSAVSRIDSPDPATAGQNITFTTLITNLGPDTANNVVINDYLPPGAIFVSANITSGSCTPPGSSVVCNVSSIPNGGSVTVTVVIKINEGGTYGSSASVASSTYDPNTANNNKSASTGVIASYDRSISKTDLIDPVLVGTTITYKIIVTNLGPSTAPASSLTVTDTLPAGTTYQSASGTDWSCMHVAGVVTCTRTGNLAPGAAPDITVTVTAPSTAGTINNTASLAASANDPVGGNNSQTISTTVNPPSIVDADLSISKSDSPDPVSAGGTLTYTVMVANSGPASANNVTVVDTLPAGVTFVSAGGTGWSCGHNSGVVTCTYGSALGIASAPNITITVTAPPQGGVISNSATVSATQVDLNMSNNTTGPVSTTVGAVTNLSITKTDSPDPVLLPGDPLTYTITVTNNGPSNATGVVITDTLPASVTFLPSPQSSANCTEGPVDTITCTIGSLASGANSQVTIKVQTSVAEMIGNYATVTGNETDPNLANNTVLQTTNVGDLSRLVNISTRGFVSTGDNVMIGGFWIGGSLTKRMFVRARGPSLANFGIAGAMANPTLEIYSGGTLVAQNNDWQDAPQCSAGYTCYDAAAITATGLSPCSVTTAGCTLDSGVLVDLPPGGYTAILKGVNNGTGVGIIEVFDPDTGSLPKIVNISTRGLVLTGDSVMIGGFWIGAGSGQKSVLVRARGPSLADFGVAGAMANPTLELYSGATKIAENNDWQTTQALCGSPAVACGNAAEIQASGLDPCSVTTAGCTLDSAIHVTLPPGGYTAILKGVNNGTGVGIVEVFELSQ